MNGRDRLRAELRRPETWFLVALVVWSVLVVSSDLLRR